MSEQKYKADRFHEGLCSTKDMVKELAKVLSIGVCSNEVKDADGKEVAVSWVSSNTSICKVSGNTVTGVAKGNATVKTTYKDATYTCIVRVSG